MVEKRAALKRHWSDIENQDVVHKIYHDDVVVEFPQSGERFLGRANLRAMREAYPDKVSATVRQKPRIRRFVGDGVGPHLRRAKAG